jgi:hypothetical protein
MDRALLLRTTMLAALVVPGPASAAPSKAVPSARICQVSAKWTPLPGGTAAAKNFGRRVSNWIGVAPDGSMTWNGSPISGERTAQYLSITKMMTPRPALVLNRLPGTDCVRLRAAAALVERSADCGPGLCWPTAGASRLPSPPPPPAPPPRPR